jgi:hypothetical protein
MSLKERHRRKGPAFKTHQTAHHEILANKAWFGDGPPVIGKQNSKLLVMVNIIPLWIAHPLEELADLDVRNLNRRLKAAQERFLRDVLLPTMEGAKP